jgi:hypothetical protein
MEAKLYGQNKGGMSINGIIKDYYAYAGENISAGDLVEYVNGVAEKVDYGESVDTQLSTETNSGYTISAVQLDKNRVFIAHSYGSSYYLYGMVVTIDGTNISYSEDTWLSSTQYAGAIISTCLLPNGNVFIAHNYGSDYHLYGMVVSINGTTISSKGSDTTINSTTYAGSAISACLLPNGNVFIAHSGATTSYYLYGIVCSVNGTTITKGNDIALVSSGNAGSTISTCLLPNGNVFIAHSYGTNHHLYGMMVSIDGTTITKGSDTAINTTKYAGEIFSAITLPNGNVFIAHNYDSTYYLRGVVCTISGTTISKGTTYTLNDTSQACRRCISAKLLPNGDVFVTHGYSSNTNLYGMIVKIDGTAITKGTDTRLSAVSYSGWTISPLLLESSTIFITHSNNGSSPSLYAQIWRIDAENNIPTNHIIATEYETQIRQVTTAQFDGIAKTSGTGGDDTGHKDKVSMWTKIANAIIELLGIPPLRLPQTSGKNLIDYTIHGASGGVGDKTDNLIDYTQAYPRNTNQKVEIDTENNAVIWSGDYFFYIPTSAQAGETLVFDCESEYRYKWALHYIDGTNATNVLNGEEITATKEVDAIMVYKTSVSTTVQNMVFKNLMLNYGEQVKEYEPYGYKIPVVSSNDTDSITTNIYLDEPLGQGENINYITDGLPDIPTLEGSTVIDVDTAVKPNPMELKYES